MFAAPYGLPAAELSCFCVSSLSADNHRRSTSWSSWSVSCYASGIPQPTGRVVTGPHAILGRTRLAIAKSFVTVPNTLTRGVLYIAASSGVGLSTRSSITCVTYASGTNKRWPRFLRTCDDAHLGSGISPTCPKTGQRNRQIPDHHIDTTRFVKPTSGQSVV